MATALPMQAEMKFTTFPETAPFEIPDAQPTEDFVLEDAEEEEFAELWANDRGNQGA